MTPPPNFGSDCPPTTWTSSVLWWRTRPKRSWYIRQRPRETFSASPSAMLSGGPIPLRSTISVDCSSMGVFRSSSTKMFRGIEFTGGGRAERGAGICAFAARRKASSGRCGVPEAGRGFIADGIEYSEGNIYGGIPCPACVARPRGDRADAQGPRADADGARAARGGEPERHREDRAAADEPLLRAREAPVRDARVGADRAGGADECGRGEDPGRADRRGRGHDGERRSRDETPRLFPDARDGREARRGERHGPDDQRPDPLREDAAGPRADPRGGRDGAPVPPGGWPGAGGHGGGDAPRLRRGPRDDARRGERDRDEERPDEAPLRWVWRHVMPNAVGETL